MGFGGDCLRVRRSTAARWRRAADRWAVRVMVFLLGVFVGNEPEEVAGEEESEDECGNDQEFHFSWSSSNRRRRAWRARSRSHSMPR